MISNLSERSGLCHFDAAAACREELRAVGYSPPGWRHSLQLSHKPSLIVTLESLASLSKGGNVTRRCCLGALPESAHRFVLKVPSGGSPMCDRPLDCLGHHRASFSRAGVLVSLWSQQPHGCAVRQERESRRTFSCGIWTLWQRERRTD